MTTRSVDADRPQDAQSALDARGPLVGALVAAQAGEESGFSELYRHLQPGLLRYLRVLSGTDAEDVASETWVHVCRDLHSFHGAADDFRGWVVAIGRHRALDRRRSERRHPADVWPAAALNELPDPAATEVQALDALATTAAVALIATLPTEQAEAVMLRAVIGMDAKAAGRVLGKRPGSVRTSAYRGLKTLAARLQSEEQNSTVPTCLI